MEFEIFKMRIQDSLLLDEECEEVLEVCNIRDILNNSKIHAQEYYVDEYGFYKKVVDELAKCIINSKFNILEAIGFLSYLIQRGKLLPEENDFRFDESIKIEDELSGNIGSEVLLGRGCCRHLSAFFRDVLRASGFDVKFILNDIFEIGDFTYTFYDKIHYDTAYLREVHEPDSDYVEGKHACIMFEFNNQVLVYDPTNLVILRVEGFKAISLGGIDNMQIKLLPASLLLYDDFSYQSMVDYYNGIINNEFNCDDEEVIIEEIIRGIRNAKNNFTQEQMAYFKELTSGYRKYRNKRIDESIHAEYRKKLI